MLDIKKILIKGLIKVQKVNLFPRKKKDKEYN